MVSPVQALRKLSRRDSTPEHHAAYVEQLTPETNHRGAAIIMCANVETALDAALQSMLFLDETSTLLDGEDQFSSLAKKIELGYALRIYGPQVRSNLTIMRHLRNAFAHAKIPLTFDTPGSRRRLSAIHDHGGNWSFHHAHSTQPHRHDNSTAI